MPTNDAPVVFPASDFLAPYRDRLNALIEIQNSILDHKRIVVMGVDYYSWRGVGCRICGKPLTNCDSLGSCREHWEFVSAITELENKDGVIGLTTEAVDYLDSLK